MNNPNKILELEIHSVSDLPVAAKKLLDFAEDAKIFLFYAPMGAGKTTLIKECCKLLGSNDHFSSPTYAIINEYQCSGAKIFHFDLYRLKDELELMDLGIEDYLGGKDYCFFEWPELVENMIDVSYVKVEISLKENIRYLRAFQL